MDNNKLFKLLTFVKKVESTNWKYVTYIIQNISSIIEVEKEWGESYKNHPLDLSKLDIWCTYENCVNFTFYNQNNQLFCKVEVFNGDNLYGYRKDLRFEALLILPSNFITNLRELIEIKLNLIAEESYNKFLENKRKEWIYDFKVQLLEKLDINT